MSWRDGRVASKIRFVDFADIMHLESHGPDTWVGVGPQYPWGGLYGGQIVAQALRAAAHSVDPAYQVHSLHAYFIRRGDAEEPCRFEVDRLRDGRSFVTRSVTVRQAIGAIFAMEASFQRSEEAAEVQTAQLPNVPGPLDVVDSGSWSAMFERRFVSYTSWASDESKAAAVDLGPGRSSGWLRMTAGPADDPIINACALAYLSDDLPDRGGRRFAPRAGHGARGQMAQRQP